MKLIELYFANKKLKQIERAMETRQLVDLAKAADMDLEHPMFAQMPLTEAFEIIQVRLADRLRKIAELKGIEIERK